MFSEGGSQGWRKEGGRSELRMFCICPGVVVSAPFPPHNRKIPPELVLCLILCRRGTTLERAWQPRPA